MVDRWSDSHRVLRQRLTECIRPLACDGWPLSAVGLTSTSSMLKAGDAAQVVGSNLGGVVLSTSPSSKLKEATGSADDATHLYDHQGIAPRRGKRRLSPETRRQIADQRRAGALVKQLAADYGLNRQTIMDILRTEGIPARKATLGPEHRDEVARLYATGLSIAQVALRFGVSDDVMFNAFRRLNIPTRPRRGMG